MLCITTLVLNDHFCIIDQINDHVNKVWGLIQPIMKGASLYFSFAIILCCILLYYFIILFFVFLGLHVQHMEVPRLGAESELQRPTYATVTAMQDLSCICELHHSSWQCQIFNPLNEARD